jgi:PKD repeat protein
VTAYQNITLDMTPPVANAGQNQTVLVGMSVAFNGGNSTDNNAVVAYVWDFGDGANGTGIAPSHVYSAAGNYTVRLTVRDAAGNSASSSATAAINVVIPEFSSALAFTAIMTLLSALAVAFRRKKVAKATYP